MLEWLRHKTRRWARPAGEDAHALYAAIAAASRNPDFYTRFAVADTIDGRFDALVLHSVPVLRRLKAVAGGEGDALAQGVVDTMFADLDLSLHEMGVADTKVGRRVKDMARAFLGRMQSYDAALDAGDGKALTAALVRNVYRGKDNNGGKAGVLAKAVMAVAENLAALPDESARDAAQIARVLARMGGK